MSAPFSLQVCRNAVHGRLRKLVLFPDFFLAVAAGEIARWSDGNGVYLWNRLQNEAVFAAHNVRSLALAGFFHQPPQIGFGGAEAKTLRLQIDFAPSRRMICNFHRLIVACLWVGVEGLFGIVQAAAGSVRTGGAVLDWAIKHGARHGGWCPKRRTSEH